eukprot:jgi/Galph1/2512/GphlegSOOS_G1145.1
MFPLVLAAQPYDWGQEAQDSLVYKLLQANLNWAKRLEPKLELPMLDETRKYAELWIGTHPSLPSFVAQVPFTTLESVLRQETSTVGNERRIEDKMAISALPFLLKVLSIRKTLSIQAHPTHSLAAVLHKKDPSHYPDDNHKPEMAIALTSCKVLYGLRPFEEIESTLREFDELREACGNDISSVFLQKIDACSKEEQKALLRDLLSSLMYQNSEIMANCIYRLVKRLQDDSFVNNVSEDLYRKDLLLTLYKQHGCDSGIFLSLFMNYLSLQAGEAMFIAANEPHAYVSGELVEVMACSDNVVRAGLTPKFKDVSTLLQMLTFDEVYPTDCIFSGKQVDKGIVQYTAPVDEFELEIITVNVGENLPQFFKLTSLLLCLEGSGSIKRFVENDDRERRNYLLKLVLAFVLFLNHRTLVHILFESVLLIKEFVHEGPEVVSDAKRRRWCMVR